MTLVQIVVAPGCTGYNEARRLAAEVKQRFPLASVHLIDILANPSQQPAGVVAVPTYLIDGRIVSLGTPADEAFYGWIAGRLVGPRSARREP